MTTRLKDDEYLIDNLSRRYPMLTQGGEFPGKTTGVICLEPRSPPWYFIPIAAAMYVHNTETRDRGVVRITAVRIGQHPQELFDNTHPSNLTSEYIESTRYDPVEIARARPSLEGDRARPVAWGMFSTVAFCGELQLTFFCPHPAGTLWRVQLCVWGSPVARGGV